MGRQEIHNFYNEKIEDRFDSEFLFEAMMEIALKHHPEYSEHEAAECVMQYLEDRMNGNLHDL